LDFKINLTKSLKLNLVFLFLEGIHCVDGLSEEDFILKAHVLTWSGDIPALSKCLNLSGHNAYKGCRFCQIEGICHESNHHVYFPQVNSSLDLRTHKDTLDIMDKIDHEENKQVKNEIIKRSGNI